LMDGEEREVLGVFEEKQLAEAREEPHLVDQVPPSVDHAQGLGKVSKVVRCRESPHGAHTRSYFRPWY
jgi:hypothetical protein